MKIDGSDRKTAASAPGGKAEDKTRTLKQQISGMAAEFERALPGKIGTERMTRIVMTAILKNPSLALCEPNSFFGAVLQSLQLGLEVNTPLGQAYLIPRRKNDPKGGGVRWECNFQMGYQGLLDLCYRYGKYRRITADVVYQGDSFEYQYGSSQFIRHIPKGSGRNPTHVWGLYELENGGVNFSVWTWETCMRFAEQFSDSFDKDNPWKSPWTANEFSSEEMAKKSVLKNLLKYAPKSVEMSLAFSADGHAIAADKDDIVAGQYFSVKQIESPNQDDLNGMSRSVPPGKEPAPPDKEGTRREAAQPEPEAPPDKPAPEAQSLRDEAEEFERRHQLDQEGIPGPDFD
ncbi:MAG: recombinase RecT [Treponema sp.]|jgi:recombination protein RecT|nr:recombinase RecT [Treponema sp.]